MYFLDTRNFTVTYNGNGYTGGSVPIDPTLYAPGTQITLPGQGSLVKAGYDFGGWRVNDTGPVAGSPYTIPNSNTTFFAIWEPDIVPEVNR